MDKKIREYIEDNIEWSKGVQGGWCGGFTFKSGYRVSIVACPTMKMREAKSYIREKLPETVAEVAEERNLTIM